MNILFVSTKNPFPIVDGHSLRTYNLIKQAALDFNIYLLTFLQREEEAEGIRHMKEICKEVISIPLQSNNSRLTFWVTVLCSFFSQLPFVVLKYRSVKMTECMESMIKQRKIDIVHLDLLPLAQYSKIAKGKPTILVDHNVETELLKRRLRKEGYPKKLFLFLEWLKLRKYERWSLRQVNRTITVSERDRAILEKWCPDAEVEVVENGVDTRLYTNDRSIEENNTLVYVGGLDWFPNLDAIQYFFFEILPLIKKVIPETKLRVVGKVPKTTLNINDDSIEFLGFVEDERDTIKTSSVFIVPLRIGGGTRLKILNALSMGKAIVSTSIGCEGLDVENNKNIIVADDPQEFAECVCSLLKSTEKRLELGKQGRLLAEKRYDWRIMSAKMNAIYNSLTI